MNGTKAECWLAIGEDNLNRLINFLERVSLLKRPKVTLTILFFRLGHG